MTADSLSLHGKVAIVTGSGRENGIGAGIALALARSGASVVVNYVSDSTRDRAANVCETLREAGGQAIAVQAAVDTLEGARDLVSKTLEGFKTDYIDILVNNAGTAFFSPITGDPDVGQLAKIFQLNVLGPFYMVNSVVPHMRPGGRIVNISSTNSKRGNVAISTYAASKAALDNLTWTWADEVCSHFLFSLDISQLTSFSSLIARPEQRHHCQLRSSRPGSDGYIPKGTRGRAHGCGDSHNEG